MGSTIFVTVEDSRGVQSRVTLSKAGDLFEIGEAANLKDFVSDHSNAKVVRYGTTATTEVADDELGEGEYDQVQQKLKTIFRDADEEETVTFSMPAPVDDDLDTEQLPTEAYINAVKSKIAELTAREENDLRYTKGGLVSKLPRK